MGNPPSNNPNDSNNGRTPTNTSRNHTSNGTGNQGSSTTTSSSSSTQVASAQEVSSLVHQGTMLNQHDDAYIDPSWILLDSESTDHIFCNAELLTDIKPSPDGEVLQLHTLGGILDTQEQGQFGDLTVWYNPNYLANVLSLALVTDRYRVTMDSALINGFKVHISSQYVIPFNRITRNLYLFNTNDIDIHKLRQAFSFLNTVSDNKIFFQLETSEKPTLHLHSIDESTTSPKTNTSALSSTIGYATIPSPWLMCSGPTPSTALPSHPSRVGPNTKPPPGFPPSPSFPFPNPFMTTSSMSHCALIFITSMASRCSTPFPGISDIGRCPFLSAALPRSS